ncbi:glycosyltransferase [Paenibacillus agri]|uniref:Glycosyltransferase n=1 Tax=Paenibacillus agri TaxID=2744309 RepID=A0A850EKM5_9BACL|nr:glycosyltransferase [Paenibacillus agri]NUU60936.1 glycosyltransferase [Paenibacillus agri]
MNEYKICFITCLNDKILYSETVRYIRSLSVPNGYEVELVSICDYRCLSEGYDRGMRQSDAKYKVYLHQDTLIINKSFISDILSIFLNNSKLGMLGVLGAKKLPPNGFFSDAKECYGMVCESNGPSGIKILNANEVLSDYEPVEAIDGLIMVTQYDVTWRSDLFLDWHMYDISQAIEFKRAGYEVGVPRQESSWCMHDRSLLDYTGYEEERLAFLKEYSEDLFPLVSILIPACNKPYHLELALQSVLYQSYHNVEIIIGDDSTNDEVQKIVEPYLERYKRITYYRNEKKPGAVNLYKLYSLARGEFINFLMDDDLFVYDKIEKMVMQFYKHDTISLVTSRRQLIDENGEFLNLKNYSEVIFSENTILNGMELGSQLLSKSSNLIGEPTTGMFRRKEIEKYGFYYDKDFNALNDVATWITLMEKGDVLYLAESLSYSRQYSEQNKVTSQYKILGMDEWLRLIIESRKHGFFKNDLMYKEAISNYLKLTLDVVSSFHKEELIQTLDVSYIQENFDRAMKEFLAYQT